MATKMSRKDKMKNMRKRAEEQGKENASKGGNYIKLPPHVDFFSIPFAKGKHKANIFVSALPYESLAHNYSDKIEPGGLYFKKTYYIHKNIGPDQQKVVCLAKTFGKPCPICEELAELNRDRDGNEDRIKELRASQRELYLFFDHDADNKKDKLLYLFDISYHCFGKALDSEIDELEDDALWFADPDDQIALAVRMTDEFYGEADRIDFDPYKKPLPDWAIDHGVDLNSVLIEKTYEELLALHTGIDPEDDHSSRGRRSHHDEEEEEEEEETRSSRRRSRRDEEEEEEEEETRSSRRRNRRDEEEEEEEEEETRSSRRRRQRDEEEEEEEEEEPESETTAARKLREKIDEEEKPSERQRTRNKTKKEEPEEEPECPNGYTFGEDYGTKRKCTKCKLNEECEAAAPPEEEEEEEEKKETKSKEKKKQKSSSKCPSGYRFGHDCGSKRDCRDCGVWSECDDEHERLNNNN